MILANVSTFARPAMALMTLLLCLLLSGCTLYATATHWNGRVGPNGRPVFIKSSTNIGLNMGIVVPILGSTTMDKMVDSTTAEIASERGDRIRIIESAAENYWYGFPPLTWFLTPVVTTVTVEYEPDAEELARVLAERGEEFVPAASSQDDSREQEAYLRRPAAGGDQ